MRGRGGGDFDDLSGLDGWPSLSGAEGTDDGDDNWLGTIIMAGLALVVVVGLIVWELAGGPALVLGFLGPAGSVALVAALAVGVAAALVRGENPDLVRSAVALGVMCVGFALLHQDPDIVGFLGAPLVALGAMLLVRRTWLALRRLFGVELEERHGTSRWIALMLIVLYCTIAGFGPGTLHVVVLLALLWPLVPGTSAMVRRMDERWAGFKALFQPREPEPAPVMEWVDPLAKFPKQHHRAINQIKEFVRSNYQTGKTMWEPEIAAVYDSPGFTTFVLEVPMTVSSQAVIARENDIARAIQRPEDAVAVLGAGEEGGVYIQVRKKDQERTKLWYTDALAAGRLRDTERHPTQVVIGVDQRGQPVLVEIEDQTEPHLLVTGTSGSGKSYLIHVILTQLLRNSPDDLQIAVIDPKTTFGMRYDRVPHLFCPVAKGSDDAFAKTAIGTMKAVRDEMVRRQSLFEAAGASSLGAYRRHVQENGGTATIPTFIFIMDEAADLSDTDDKELKTAYQQYVKEIALKGRALGVLLIIGVQRPSQENIGKFRSNLMKRIVLLLTSPSESKMAFGDEGPSGLAATKLGGRGDGFVFSPRLGRIRFSGAYLPDEIDDERPDLTVANVVSLYVDHWAQQGFPPRDWSRDVSPVGRTSSVITTGDDSEVPVTEAEARISAEHNEHCSDREWLVIAGVQLAFIGQSDPYATTTFTPEAFESFVRRAAVERGYSGKEIKAEEIQHTLGRMFPGRDGKPQRERSWPLNKAIVEGRLLAVFAAAPDGEAEGGAKGARSAKVSGVKDRVRRDP